MTARPHVALVFKKLRPSGGAEQMAGLILDVFRGFDVHLSVLARDLDGTPQGFDFYPVKPRHVGRLGKVRGFAHATRQILDRLEPDLVVSQEHVGSCNVYRAGGGVYAEWLSRRRRLQNRWKRFWMDADPHHRAKLALERATYESRGLQAVICNSQMVRDDILRHYPVGPERLHVIENALDPQAYRRPDDADAGALALRRELNVPQGAPLWVFVGSGFERKGLGIAIRALARSRGQGHLAVVGGDHRLRYYHRLAIGLGIGDRVHFVGNQRDVRPYLWAGDGMLHPAHYEAYGLVVLEAMAAGLPVLSSYQCGAANALIRPGENGFIHDAGDVAGLADSIDRIEALEAPAAVARAAAAAAAPHDLDRLRADVQRLCEQLLAERWPAPAAATGA